MSQEGLVLAAVTYVIAKHVWDVCGTQPNVVLAFLLGLGMQFHVLYGCGHQPTCFAAPVGLVALQSEHISLLYSAYYAAHVHRWTNIFPLMTA